ncbi:hypothetical protein AOA60_26925, partial [Pseudomonas sp. 2822-17]
MIFFISSLMYFSYKFIFWVYFYYEKHLYWVAPLYLLVVPYIYGSFIYARFSGNFPTIFLYIACIILTVIPLYITHSEGKKQHSIFYYILSIHI